MAQPTISVVVPAYHWKPHLVSMSVRCIEAAKSKTAIPFTTIVVETTTSHLQEYADIHIYEKDRVGPTKSMNRAFAIADTDYTVLLTNDCFVHDGWLEALIEPFNIFDNCGITTIGSYQFNHWKRKYIEEGNWFSVACWKTQGKIFDERFLGVWDDTDFIMRTYVNGKKFYRNFSGLADHLVGATHYELCDHNDNFNIGKTRFIEKWKHLIGTEHEHKYKELAGL